MPVFILSVDLPVSEREIHDVLANTWLSGNVQIRPTPAEPDSALPHEDCPHCGDKLFCAMCGESVLHRRAG
jgi:hypothetical protein